MSAQSDISDVIAEAWTATSPSESGLARDITASDTMIRALTDAIAAGVVSAMPVVPGGLPLKGWLYALTGRTVTASSGLDIDQVSARAGYGVVAPASLGARVLVVFTSGPQRISSSLTIFLPFRSMTTSSTPAELIVLSSDLISGNTGFTGCAQTVALAF